MVTPLKREFVHFQMLMFKLCMYLCLAAFGVISKEVAATRKKLVPGFLFRLKIKSKTFKQNLSKCDCNVVLLGQLV